MHDQLAPTRPFIAVAAIVAITLVAPATAEAVEVRFEVRQDTGWGESVYVIGDRPELGDGDRAGALRMVPDGGLWRLAVDLPAGAAYRYQYLVRSNDADRLADAGNARAVSGVIDATAPGGGGELTVRVRYVSGFSQAMLRYGYADGDWRDAAMTIVGNGRNASEHVWEATVRTRRGELEFVPHDGAGRWDNPPGGGNYRTRAATATLQDGRLAAGTQPASGGSSRIEIVRRWYSRILGNARDVFVYLPPSYDAQPGRRFPVLYAHDGQNIFGPDAMFGGWRMELAADRMIREGRMEEVIIVGLANTSGRMSEYMPNEEGGDGRRYTSFIVDEIKPWVDRTWRTKTGRESTGVIGSSLGGLISVFIGWERPDVFGKVGSLSGSFWLPELSNRIEREPRRDVRVWLDSGNAGNSDDSLENTIRLRDILLRKGFVLGDDLGHLVDYGASHNEVYWRGRVHRALEFLFPAR